MPSTFSTPFSLAGSGGTSGGLIFELECCSIGSMQQVARSDCSKPSGRSTHGVASLSHDRLPHPPRESAAPRSVVQTAAETACTEELKSAQETPKHRASQERAHKAARTQGGQAAEKGGGDPAREPRARRNARGTTESAKRLKKSDGAHHGPQSHITCLSSHHSFKPHTTSFSVHVGAPGQSAPLRRERQRSHKDTTSAS